MDDLARELSLPVSKVARHAHYVAIIVQNSKIAGNIHILFSSKSKQNKEILLKLWENGLTRELSLRFLEVARHANYVEHTI